MREPPQLKIVYAGAPKLAIYTHHNALMLRDIWELLRVRFGDLLQVIMIAFLRWCKHKTYNYNMKKCGTICFATYLSVIC